MGNQREDFLPVRSYLLQKLRENTSPYSLSIPMNLSKSKLYLPRIEITQNNEPNMPTQRPGYQQPISHRMTGSWMGISPRLFMVARCSTSHSNTNTNLELNQNGMSGFDLPEEAGDENLPGLPRNRPNKGLISRKSVANDMQVNQMIEQETGLQRLQAMYAIGPDGMFLQEDTRTITTIFYRSVLLGFFLNVVKAAQTESKITKHMSASQAAMKTGMNAVADSTKIIKQAGKQTLRLTAFAGSLIYLSQSIAAYRNQSSLWEYSISTAAAMACVAFGKAPKPFLLTVSGGAVAGALGGSLICSLMSSTGASQEQRTLNRIRQQLEQQQNSSDLDNEIVR